MNKTLLTFLLLSGLSFGGNLCSDLQAEGNNRTPTNVFITPNPVWQPNGTCGKWISFTSDPSGIGNVAIPGPANATFFERFFLSGAGTASLTVFADDTATVWIDNLAGRSTLVLANPTLDAHCARGSIACQPGEGRFINLTPYLTSGYNTVGFEVYQRGGGPYGLMYEGTYNSDINIAHTPEPSTLGLAISGLTIILGYTLLRKYRSRYPLSV